VSSASQLNKVIFRDTATAPVGRKFVSLFPGLGYAAGYKVRSRLPWGDGRHLADDKVVLLWECRSSSGYTSMVASRWRATSSLCTTARTLKMRLARRQAKLSCIRLPAGKDQVYKADAIKAYEPGMVQ